MSENRICTYCVMDNVGDNTIHFDEHGQCNYCKDTIRRMPFEYFPNDEGKKKLDEIMQAIKNKTALENYNCMVGVSGGIDSSYILYLGHKYGLKMLAVHIDDGLDTEIAKENLKKLCEAANAELIVVKPNIDEYKDILLSFFKASVPNLAMPQDNILLRALADTTKEYKIKYSLSGANFSTECILDRSTNINANDGTHIKAIHDIFGEKKISNIKLNTLFRRYIGNRYLSKVETICPLNYIDYNMERVLKELNDFCGFEYYGGKHYESILTRFLQCYYLPIKYKEDKRKSHFSSMIVSGQMTREDAIERLATNPYIESGLYREDMRSLAQYFGLSEKEFCSIVSLPAKRHDDYKKSYLNKLAPLARKFRRVLG